MLEMRISLPLLAAVDTNSGVSFFKIVFFCTGSIGGGPPLLLSASINKHSQNLQIYVIQK